MENERVLWRAGRCDSQGRSPLLGREVNAHLTEEFDMSEISSYITAHTTIVAPLQKDYSLKFWDLSLSGNEEREKALVAAKESYLKVYNNRVEFKQIREWKSAKIPLDELEARQLRLIHDAFVPNQIEPDVLRGIIERET